MKNHDCFNRLLVLLLITLTLCTGLYGLPETIFEQKIKTVDIFADIRTKDNATPTTLDSLRIQLEYDEAAELFITEEIDTILPSTAIDSMALSASLRDSISRVMNAAKGISDPQGASIEDYSPGGRHTGLKRFFSALDRSRTRPVRIAFMGDSFIEGDIMVADFRSAMQQEFGGHGVGFVPIITASPQYRPTVNQQADGWKIYSIVNSKNPGYTLSGMMFEARYDQAVLSFTTTSQYPALRKVNALKLLYDRNERTTVQFVYNDIMDTLVHTLPPTYSIAQYEISDTISEGRFTFSSVQGFRAIGIALEDRTGVVVDNFSLRGNSGLIFEQLDPAVSASFRAIRPYDLIILQYGLNAMDEDMLDYGWYGARMAKVVRRLQSCFPESDILMLSVPDRANQYNGAFSTMPAVLALLHTQRQTARTTGIPFWNMFGAMGGENSMVRFVDKGWAGKDYTHLTFNGGREIARSLMKVLMKEKEFYDETEEKAN
jgi:lysophospholipase L1-like esterase